MFIGWTVALVRLASSAHGCGGAGAILARIEDSASNHMVTRIEIGESILYVLINRGWAVVVRFLFFSFCISIARNGGFILTPDSAVCCIRKPQKQNPESSVVVVFFFLNTQHLGSRFIGIC